MRFNDIAFSVLKGIKKIKGDKVQIDDAIKEHSPKIDHGDWDKTPAKIWWIKMA